MPPKRCTTFCQSSSPNPFSLWNFGDHTPTWLAAQKGLGEHGRGSDSAREEKGLWLPGVVKWPEVQLSWTWAGERQNGKWFVFSGPPKQKTMPKQATQLTLLPKWRLRKPFKPISPIYTQEMCGATSRHRSETPPVNSSLLKQVSSEGQKSSCT